MHQPFRWHAAPPPPDIDPPGRGKRTARTWWLAGGLTVLLAIPWAGLLLWLAYLRFLTIPAWLLIMLTVAVACFIGARRHPSALAYGIATLCSMPLTAGLILAVLAIGSRHG